MMAKVAKKIWVSGLVQGVGFRYYTQRQAEILGVSGYARNLADGRVEVVAEGEQHNVQQMVDWLEQGGPSHARVDALEQEEITVGDYAGFDTH
ncbi:acylphosphatase [Zobellella maritima]|uniref:acylphosphatase n=1 Tax=Zobellella maritima TaxID=2059725 RepID=UPI001E450346|nr:acylphosphatase [Zobellella maritima]